MIKKWVQDKDSKGVKRLLLLTFSLVYISIIITNQFGIITDPNLINNLIILIIALITGNVTEKFKKNENKSN